MPAALLPGGAGVVHADTMPSEVDQKWQQPGGADGPAGEFRSEKAVNGEHHANFDGGDITHRSGTSAHFVKSGILYAWRADGATGNFGFARTDEQAAAKPGDAVARRGQAGQRRERLGVPDD